MADQEEAQEEPRQDSDRLEEVRAWGDRQEKRAKDLESQLADLRQTTRAQAIRQAGVDPSSWTGQAVMAAVEQSNISDPDDISSLVRVIQAENRGESHATA
jgi:hypothetical protein